MQIRRPFSNETNPFCSFYFGQGDKKSGIRGVVRINNAE